ncbi:MAG: hypothetical protein AABZ55_07935 [Bdellovibrionota bacterium]
MKNIYLMVFVFLCAFSTSHGSSKKTTDRVLWDYWYTVSVEKDHAQYYNEKVEIKDGKLACFQRVWKKEEGFINEEQLGSFALDDLNLTPLFFNFHSTYRETETTIDGSIADGKLLTVKAKRGDKELPFLKKSIQSKVFLQCFFPVWLGRLLPQLKEGKLTVFNTIFEDTLEMGFKAIRGSVRLEKKDEFAKKSDSSRVSIGLDNGVKASWWVEKNGALVRMESGSPLKVFERVSKQKATQFLND